MLGTSMPNDLKLQLGITPNLVRLSVGIEYHQDLITDLEQAMKSIAPPRHNETSLGRSGFFGRGIGYGNRFGGANGKRTYPRAYTNPKYGRPNVRLNGAASNIPYGGATSNTRFGVSNGDMAKVGEPFHQRTGYDGSRYPNDQEYGEYRGASAIKKSRNKWSKKETYESDDVERQEKESHKVKIISLLMKIYNQHHFRVAKTIQ